MVAQRLVLVLILVAAGGFAVAASPTASAALVCAGPPAPCIPDCPEQVIKRGAVVGAQDVCVRRCPTGTTGIIVGIRVDPDYYEVPGTCSPPCPPTQTGLPPACTPTPPVPCPPTFTGPTQPVCYVLVTNPTCPSGSGPGTGAVLGFGMPNVPYQQTSACLSSVPCGLSPFGTATVGGTPTSTCVVPCSGAPAATVGATFGPAIAPCTPVPWCVTGGPLSYLTSPSPPIGYGGFCYGAPSLPAVGTCAAPKQAFGLGIEATGPFIYACL